MLTQIFMLCLCYRPEAEFIRSIVDKIYSDSSLIVYEDGQIGIGSLVEEMIQRMFAFLSYAGGVGPRRLSLIFFFGWNFESTLIVMSTLSVDESADKNKMRVFWEGTRQTLYFLVGQDLHKQLYPKRIWSYSSFLQNVSYGICGWYEFEKRNGRQSFFVIILISCLKFLLFVYWIKYSFILHILYLITSDTSNIIVLPSNRPWRSCKDE